MCARSLEILSLILTQSFEQMEQAYRTNRIFSAPSQSAIQPSTTHNIISIMAASRSIAHPLSLQMPLQPWLCQEPVCF